MKQSAIIAVLLLIASMSIHMYADARMTDAERKRQLAIASKVVDNMEHSGELLATVIKLSDAISEDRFRYYIQQTTLQIARIDAYSDELMRKGFIKRFTMTKLDLKLNELRRTLAGLSSSTTRKRRDIIRKKYSQYQCSFDQCGSPSKTCREYCRESNQFIYDAIEYNVIGFLEE